MCGIHGIIYFNKVSRKKLQVKIKAMLDIAKHRGPDQSDFLVFDQAAIGMNRLAIIAPNEYSTIQSTTEEKKYALFNGEIVNYRVLRKFLKNPLRSQHTDSAIILPLFKEFGPEFIRKLAGMFAIAIYDQYSNSLQLWRDPLGIKPLYYYHSADCVIFSSELKAIYAVLDNTPEADFAALDHCLRYRFHPGQVTVFPQIKRVLPGETVLFKDGQISRHRYWNLKSNRLTMNRKSSIEQFRSLLEQLIREYAQADVKGGYFVSGGLDSSLVTAIALKEKSPFTQPISIKFVPHSVIDEKYGQLLEKFFKKRFEWVTITDSLARQTLEELVSYIDEPLENPIHIGTYLMAKRARELGIKSVLTGDGSDEFFLGYERIACWFNNASVSPSEDYPRWLWTLKPSEATDLYTKEAVASTQPMLNSFNRPIEPFKNIDQVLLFERIDHLSEYHNMRLDRMTMAHGVEARVPLQDHRLVEYTLNIPLSTLFGVSGKEWLQQAARPWVPAEILNRPKIHFPSLSDQWLSGAGIKWAAEILLDHDAYSRRWLKSSVVERYINEHDKNVCKRGRLLWALVVLELWFQNLVRWRRYII